MGQTSRKYNTDILRILLETITEEKTKQTDAEDPEAAQSVLNKLTKVQAAATAPWTQEGGGASMRCYST